MEILTLIHEGMDSWVFRQQLPPRVSPWLQWIHATICDVLCQWSVKGRWGGLCFCGVATGRIVGLGGHGVSICVISFSALTA